MIKGIETWKKFKLDDIFTFERGKCSNAPDLEEGRDVVYIGAKKSENGFMKWVANDEKLISKGNAISFICQGAGSNGFQNYFDKDTIQTTSNTLGYNDNLNKYNALFIITILDLERPKWSFGRGRAPKLAKTIIKLPSKNNKPDWGYMENFIKKLIISENKFIKDKMYETK